MKILVISLAGIGDTLMATPLIHELRANFPASTIDAFVMYPASRDVLQSNPHLNSVHQMNLMKAGKSASLGYLLNLRKQGYQISVNTHPQSKLEYRLVSRVIGATTRVSHEYDHAGFIDRLMVNKSVPQDYTRHCIENNLALLPLMGAKQLLPGHGYELFLNADELKLANDYLASNQLASRPLIGFHIGSGGTKNLMLRRWPVEHYVELIQRISAERPEAAVMLFGGPEEQEGHAKILAQTKGMPVFMPPTKNLRQAAALVGKCRVFLSVDTALMHVAATMKVPRQLVIETPTLNPTVVPYGNNFKVIKNPGVKHDALNYYRYDGAGIRGSAEELIRCMASVSVEDVFRSIDHGLDSQPS